MYQRKPNYKGKCLQCGRSFNRYVRNSFLKKRGKPKYCSPGCAQKSRGIGVRVTCAYCKKKFTRKPSHATRAKHGFNFCTRFCKERAQSVDSSQHFQKIRPSHYGDGGSYYRKRAFRNLGIKCVDCDYKVKEVLQVHHIDGDRTNNSISNLLVVCPTHHKERDLGIKR